MLNGIVQGNNPSTTCLLLPIHGCHQPPVGANEPLQYNKSTEVKTSYCNGCPSFILTYKPATGCYNTKCGKTAPRPGGANRIVKMNVKHGDLVTKPFWCPLIQESINNASSKPNFVIVGSTTAEKSHKEERLGLLERKRKFKAIKGLVGWDDIQPNHIYHMPPTPVKKRRDIEVKNKYVSSLYCIDVNTKDNIWLYKEDEDYKFLKLLV